MESDPFGFIIDSCHISSSQEEILRTCPFAGELEKLYEDECLDPGGAAVESTGVFMVSPLESTQVARNDSLTPQETYHTPPEESAPPSSASGEETILHWGCKDSERTVDLGRDSDPGLSERSERAVSQRHGLDPRFKMEKPRSLKRGPGMHDTLSKKPRLLETNEGSRWFPKEGSKILEINLRLETPDAYAGIVKEKIKENLEKAVESLKDYGSTFRREIKIREGMSTKGKLNFSVEINGAPQIADLGKEGDSVPYPRNSPYMVNDDLGLKQDDRDNAKVIGTDIDQMDHTGELRSAANISDFRYKGGNDLPSCSRGKAIAVHDRKAIAVHDTIDIRGGEQLKSQACDDQQWQRSTEINTSVAHIQRFKCDSGPEEADEENGRSMTNTAVIGMVTAEMDFARGVEGVENIEKFRENSGKDAHMGNKGRAIAESEEIGIRRGEKLKAQANDDREGQRSAVINIQKDKDGSWHKEADRDNVRSVTDVEVIGLARRDHRGEVENAENSENFRYNRGKATCLHNNGKAIAGHEEIHVRGGERPKVQSCDDHEGQKSVEINCGVESIQNMDVNGNNFGKSSNIGGLRILPSCVHELAQRVPGRVISGASSRKPKLKKIDILDILKQVVETCEGRGLEKGNILDFAKKHGITFPHQNS